MYTVRHHGGQEFGEKDEAIVSDFMDNFIGNWESDEWQHYCYTSPTDRRPCCQNPKESREKMKSSFKAVFQLLVWDKLDEGTKKWGENLRRCSKCSFMTACHRTLPQVISKAWAPAKADRDEEVSEERVEDDIHVKKKKRKSKAVRLWKNKHTPSVFLTAGIASMPIRMLLSKMFAAEREARVSSALQEPREKSLLGDFVADDGFIERADRELEELLDDTSPLLKRFCSQRGEEQKVVKRNRGM